MHGISRKDESDMELKKYRYHDINFRGTIDRVTYTTTNSAGEARIKYANVYLPYGYNSDDRETKYNILYLMHGGGGNADAWLDCCRVKNMLDYCFFKKLAKPMIVVFPSFYKEQISRVGEPVANIERTKVLEFLPEMIAELLPAVESRYNTYTVDTSDVGLRAARAHRGFGGFSMGACTTWYNFQKNLAYFRTFLPLSGDSWVICAKGGEVYPGETAKCLYDAVVEAKGTEADFRIYAATGSADPADPAMTPQIEEMKKYPDIFAFDEDPTKGNLHYAVAEGEEHTYEAVCNYLYSYLPYLFQ